MASQGHHHRPTLKQSNKSFKSKHASKGARKAAAKGKPAIISAPNTSARKAVDAGAKRIRLNQQSQKRDAKQRAGREDAKFFTMSSNGGKVPRIVSIVPLSPTLSGERLVRGLLPALGLSEADIMGLDWDGRSSFVTAAPRFKSSIHFNILPPLQLFPALDAALTSDIVIILLSSADEVQLEGEAILRCLQGQAGAVTTLACVQAPEMSPLAGSAKSLVHKSLLSFSRYFFPSVNKIFSADTANEAILLGRALCETSPAFIHHPDGRAWLVAEEQPVWSAVGSTVTGGDQPVVEPGLLRVTGTVRGGRLSANRLVHLPGYGDFQIQEILAALPRSKELSTDSPLVCLSSPGADADDLTANNVPDLLANEQTWPTEEDMMGASEAEMDGLAKRVKRVPKGTSAYQAAWIFDDDDDEGDATDADVDESGSDMSSAEPTESGKVIHLETPMRTAHTSLGVNTPHYDQEDELEDVELDERTEVHQEMTAEEEEAEYETYLRERERAQRDDINFPDEIDTPRHIAASVRFQRYRGLRSFRTSPWDPYENLPLDYGEIFQFESFAATQKRVEREAREEGVALGTRVTLVISNVPRQVAIDRAAGLPFVIHGLLRHEHKQTVLHFAVQRNTEYTEPVRAKDPLVICVGPRRYNINPLFSQHVRGGGKGVNNVHKSERYLKPGATTVVTTYGPACFGKLPCLLLKQGSRAELPDLVAMGSFLSSDPTRIIAKRIVLTGHPFKVHKKTATIRYMFFNRDDVQYFQSVELHTKYGRTGHITEALGTHGYFKAHFDGPIQQMDTVCMSLYKRQFPKWSTLFHPPTGSTSQADFDTQMELE
ncbi:DUF663-domain-containing protein [Cutaneotrichosporon oleaginosum]|uniref:DUF663-domain-containing protein n=1 Tax=Cutaneotrichosporon oleaginosum TaxID=879819 RepID=A0A0J0XFN6_9TREE|nr:DUF663-domain-containing protein [Cutaneotrichosporon oleaginosum]KLT39878.1 DUF663-domain-containing protein [Cutaneotrichosporon oleaginosum]TXT14198.1 hypothetical protein COLE_00391 [Cutaneotrichosporon oleaginosum]